MRIAIFDPFSGASGDMILGALVDAGLSLDALRAGLDRVDVAGYEIVASKTTDQVISGTRLRVELTAADQPSRQWTEIRDLIAGSALSAPVRETILAVFGRLAEAEARVHGQDVEQVHFHEVGGVDAIVDICGACIGLDALGVDAVYCQPFQTGSGMVGSLHGPLPVPAPATSLLLADARAPVAAPRPVMAGVDVELLTPTGAAILTTMARFDLPAHRPETVAYGYGTKVLPWPNALRLTLATTVNVPHGEAENEIIVETNIDDMNPQFYELLLERVLGAGAWDVWLTPVIMKKGRPGIVLSAILPDESLPAVERILLAHSTTLGLRKYQVRRTRAEREFRQVVTPWGDVRVKLRLSGETITAIAPEYDDVAAVARKTGRPVSEIWDEAKRLARDLVEHERGAENDASRR